MCRHSLAAGRVEVRVRVGIELRLAPRAAKVHRPAAGDAPATLTLNFSADGEVDALAQRARAAEPFGKSAIVGPVDTPWNTRDLRVTDPSGHRLVFTGRNANPNPEQAARMKALFDRAR